MEQRNERGPRMTRYLPPEGLEPAKVPDGQGTERPIRSKRPKKNAPVVLAECLAVVGITLLLFMATSEGYSLAFKAISGESPQGTSSPSPTATPTNPALVSEEARYGRLYEVVTEIDYQSVASVSYSARNQDTPRTAPSKENPASSVAVLNGPIATEKIVEKMKLLKFNCTESGSVSAYSYSADCSRDGIRVSLISSSGDIVVKVEDRG